MRSLKESILGSNDAGIFGKIKNLILNGETEKDIEELNQLWDSVGLGVKGCRWEIGFKQINYTSYTMILICSYGRNGWDIEITRDTWKENNNKTARKELLKKLESSGHFIIDKHPTGSEHWLAKIK